LNAQQFARLLRSFAKGVLLDLGCGKAPLYAVYKDVVSDVVCADWPASLHGNRYADVACDANRPLPFRDAVFDTVLATDLLEHIYHPAHLVTEMARILKPGGFLIINTPFMYWVHEAPHDYYRFTSYALRRMLEDAKLESVVVEACGGAPFVIADIMAKRCMRLPVVGRPIAIAVQATASLLLRSRRINAETAFPISHFVVAAKPAASTI